MVVGPYSVMVSPVSEGESQSTSTPGATPATPPPKLAVALAAGRLAEGSGAVEAPAVLAAAVLVGADARVGAGEVVELPEQAARTIARTADDMNQRSRGHIVLLMVSLTIKCNRSRPWADPTKVSLRGRMVSATTGRVGRVGSNERSRRSMKPAARIEADHNARALRPLAAGDSSQLQRVDDFHVVVDRDHESAVAQAAEHPRYDLPDCADAVGKLLWVGSPLAVHHWPVARLYSARPCPSSLFADRERRSMWHSKSTRTNRRLGVETLSEHEVHPHVFPPRCNH